MNGVVDLPACIVTFNEIKHIIGLRKERVQLAKYEVTWPNNVVIEAVDECS